MQYLDICEYFQLKLVCKKWNEVLIPQNVYITKIDDDSPLITKITDDSPFIAEKFKIPLDVLTTILQKNAKHITMIEDRYPLNFSDIRSQHIIFKFYYPKLTHLHTYENIVAEEFLNTHRKSIVSLQYNLQYEEWIF